MLNVETKEPPALFFEDFSEGQELATITKGPMLVGNQVRWAGACDNYESEFHHDEYVAKAQGLRLEPGIHFRVDCTRDDLLSISNFGEKTLEEVYKALERIGFPRPNRTARPR